MCEVCSVKCGANKLHLNHLFRCIGSLGMLYFQTARHCSICFPLLHFFIFLFLHQKSAMHSFEYLSLPQRIFRRLFCDESFVPSAFCIVIWSNELWTSGNAPRPYDKCDDVNTTIVVPGSSSNTIRKISPPNFQYGHVVSKCRQARLRY